ncbi:MAG TPA: Rid family detoxifying hydrolase, partial [Planctomycetota bacterium]|nr:Rid family detoxifying hydrolase [Planctomycetota bacterium]
AIGPYSQAVVANGVVYCSGQIPFDPATGALVAGDVGVQTRRALGNLKAVLAAAGANLSDVVRCTVFLRDMNDFAAMNEAYAAEFGDAKPSRSTVQAARLPRDAGVEIDCIAVLGHGARMRAVR